MTVNAGALSHARAALYVAIGLLAGLIVATAIVAVFGGGRFFTGLLLGTIVGIIVGTWFFSRDGVLLDDGGITVARWGRRTPIGWDRIRGARFTEDIDADRWFLTLAVKGGTEADELLLIAMPPVTRTVSDPYDMRKREQLKELYLLLSVKDVPVSIAAPITESLRTHWQLEPKPY